MCSSPAPQTIGLGVLGKEGSGRLRIVATQQKQKLSAKAQKKFKAKSYGSSGATSGLSSSLAFTPVQVGHSQCPGGQKHGVRRETVVRTAYCLPGGRPLV